MNSKITLLTLATLLLAGPVSASTSYHGSVGTEPSAIVADAPTASPGAGTYTSAQSITLSAPTADSIHYTTDGSDPACDAGTVYSAAISVPSSMTIKAVACYGTEVVTSSSIVSFAYVINIPTSGGGGGGGGGGNGPIAGALPAGGGGGGSGGTPTGSNTAPLPGGTDSGGTGGTGGSGAPATPTPPAENGASTDNGGTGGNGGTGPTASTGGGATTSQLAAAAEALGLGSTTASSTASTTSQLAAIGALFAGISPWLWWLLLLLILLGGAWWYWYQNKQ